MFKLFKVLGNKDSLKVGMGLGANPLFSWSTGVSSGSYLRQVGQDQRVKVRRHRVVSGVARTGRLCAGHLLTAMPYTLTEVKQSPCSNRNPGGLVYTTYLQECLHRRMRCEFLSAGTDIRVSEGG